MSMALNFKGLSYTGIWDSSDEEEDGAGEDDEDDDRSQDSESSELAHRKQSKITESWWSRTHERIICQ